MNFFVKNFLVLFFIGLVISITPGFAVRTGDTLNYNDTDMILSDLDKKTNDLDSLKNKLNKSEISLYESIQFVRDNAWKFWKYREVQDHVNLIVSESYELKDIADQIKFTANAIVSDSDKLDKSLNVAKSDKSHSDREFLKEVENRTNTTFDITNPINFKKGDIVQYKSEMGNIKYLEYVEIDNKTSYVILKNSANKKIALSQEFFNKTATLKISPTTPHPQIIKTIHNLQLEKINDTKNLAQKKIQTAQEMKKSGEEIAETGMELIILSGFCTALCFILAVLSFLIEPLIIVAAILLVIAFICLPTGFVIVLYGAHLINNSKDMLKNANKDLKNANALESDLNESLNSFPYASDMNLTTPAGVPVNGTLNGTDFDKNNLTYTIVEQPKNGKLNTSLNGTFIYRPNNNFTGQDSFKYKVNDGNVDSNIATVNITVLPSSTKIVIRNVKGKVGDRVNLTATLKDNSGKGIANETVTFKINNKVIGEAKTNEKGIAVLNYLLRDKGKLTLSAIFSGNNLYTATNSTSLITIESKK